MALKDGIVATLSSLKRVNGTKFSKNLHIKSFLCYNTGAKANNQ